MRLDVIGKNYRNSLEEGISTDKMVLRWSSKDMNKNSSMSAMVSFGDKGLVWFRAQHQC